MEPVAVVTALVLIEYLWIVWQTGQARGRHGVAAPATVGHPVFERWFRVQINTVEQLVVFLPALWMFATWVSPWVAAGLGVLFGLGRYLFARGYVADPARRGPGFIVTLAANAVLVVGALVGALAAWLA